MGSFISHLHGSYSGRLEKFGETSSHSSQDLKILFEDLKKHSKDDRYQDALKVMQRAPKEQQEAFATIFDTLLPPDALKVMQRPPKEQQEAFATFIHTLPPEPVPSQSNPPPAKKKKVVAYLLITGQTFQAHQQILNHLNKGPLSISVTQDVQQCDVILLFCPTPSRVRSDVESAFRKIPDGAQDKPVVLVLLHHTRKPDQVLKQTQWMDEFPMVIQEVNVLYHESQNGLLECPWNEEALRNFRTIESRSPKNLTQECPAESHSSG